MHTTTVTTATVITVAIITTAHVAQAILTISKVLSAPVELSEVAVEPGSYSVTVKEELVCAISEPHNSVQSHRISYCIAGVTVTVSSSLQVETSHVCVSNNIGYCIHKVSSDVCYIYLMVLL